jgi:hypothetical protein
LVGGRTAGNCRDPFRNLNESYVAGSGPGAQNQDVTSAPLAAHPLPAGIRPPIIGLTMRRSG